MTKSDTILYCEGLTKVYDELVALDHLNLEIPKGKVFGFIGHNGAGKTTTIRILAGLSKPSSGKATIAGVDVTSGTDDIKRVVGYMPDSFGVYDQMRVWEYLDFFGAAFKLSKKKRREQLDYALDITDAEYMRDRFVDTLSKGMKQRVGIARMLMHDPEVMLLDEPANGLDPKARVQMRILIRKLAAKGKTMLVSSHILPELAAFCDLVGMITQGKLRAFGTVESVLAALHRDRVMEVRCLSELVLAKALLEKMPGVSNVEKSEEETNALQFSFSGDDEALCATLGQLSKGGVRVVTFREVPLSLEDAYLEISDQGADPSKSQGDAVPEKQSKVKV